jgi:hypothetical protein
MTGKACSNDPSNKLSAMTNLNRKGRFATVLKSTLLLGQLHVILAGETPIPLAGTWRFQLDPKGVGLAESWFSKQLEDTVRLPGTTDENHKGNQTDERPTDRLARVWSWKGPAWYQREVTIPESWNGKRVMLFLERTKNSRVWVDGVFCGRENTLSAPHIFDVTRAAKPGKRTITVLIDNSKLPPVGPAHQVDERTQTNWNGIVGNMELRATDPVWIKDVQIYPDAAKKEARVRVVVGNATGKPSSGTITVSCVSMNVCEPERFTARSVKIDTNQAETVVDFTYQPGKGTPLWSEFHPAMLDMTTKLETQSEGNTFTDTRSICFGMRDFTRDGNLLKNNGTTIFLRGRLDCANYPLTGYAPMGKTEWRRIFSIMKEWGLNHVRFHSWCPPRAAFEAADELGFYLQIELPNKRSAFKATDSKEAAHYNIDFLEGENMDEGISLYDYGRREAELIFRHFGNHPSFVMFTLGNELGRNEGMFELVKHFKEIDPRHLYAQGSNNNHWAPGLAEGDDFWVTGKVGNDALPIRGSFYIHDYRHGAVEFNPPGTMDDFSESIRGVPVPLIGHETGQYQVFPDFREIPKYTGVLKARHYEIFRERLEKSGMLDQADDFVKASGALAAICYREDMELALRTPGFGGFQLLDIMDFPGQGTAPVGMLNVFMESKGVIDPEKWRESCSEVVPLLRIEKHAWKVDEVLKGRVEVAHYGPKDLESCNVVLSLKDEQGNEWLRLLQGKGLALKKEGLRSVGEFQYDLGKIANTPQKLMLSVLIADSTYINSYPIWVYPPKADTTPPAGVIVSRRLGDAQTKAHLGKGGKVLLLPELNKLPRSIPGMFQTEFWSPMFAQSAVKRGIEPPPGTLGILCDPKHPAFASFPTDFHTNWQWWHLVKNARSIILDETPRGYRPIVQMIDNFDRNHKLGLLFETKVGNGSLLVCAIDLPAIQDKPEGRQMLHSLLQYAGSDAFNPQSTLSESLLHKLLPD